MTSEFRKPGNFQLITYLTQFDYRDRGFERFLDETSPDVDASGAMAYFSDKPCYQRLGAGVEVDWEFVAEFMRMLHE